MQVYASTAWIRASTPVEAMTFSGRPFRTVGSTRATLGAILMSRMFSFSWASVSVMTASKVTSLPVPAVVGTAIRGTMGCSSTAGVAQVRILPPLASRVPTALAVSMELPPPMAIMPSMPCSRANSAPAMQWMSRGLGTIWS